MKLLDNVLSWRISSIDDNNGYSLFYFCFLFLLIIISLGIFFLVKEHNENMVKWVVFGFGILFLCLETYKQLYYNIIDGDGGYSWNIFPYQLCSTPLYLCLLSILFPCKIRKNIYSFLTFTCFLGGFATMLFPQTVASEKVFLYGNSLIWHIAMIWLSFYLVKTLNYGESIKEIIPSAVIFIVLTIIAMMMNYGFEVCKQNNLVDGYFNMFMISPYYECNIILLSLVVNSAGWYIGWLAYILGIIIGMSIYWMIIYTCNWLRRKIQYKPIYN